MRQRDESIRVEVSDHSDGRRFACEWNGPEGLRSHTEHAPGRTQQHYLDVFARLSPVLGTRVPINRQGRPFPAPSGVHRPLLTHNVSPQVLYGYGDPSVLWVDEERAWYMVATSNDAPDSFPILRSGDLSDWQPTGFVFPEGRQPPWARRGEASDFWAPELHRLGDRFLLCFSAREHDGSMAIGLATAPRPDGPFESPESPLIRGGMIDAHLFVGTGEASLLLWKEDSNGVWPRLLAEKLAADPTLRAVLFSAEQDRRTAALVSAMWSSAKDWPPMEQFFVLQPLIEATIERFAEVRQILATVGGPLAGQIVAAMETPIYAQPLSSDATELTGTRRVVLVNDLEWEAHLIEGPWLTKQDGRYYLFYSGNDFSTHEYGIGVAIANSPTGPFRKMDAPLLRSDAEWIAPGHPSVAPGPDGLPRLFYHAYPPGGAGYNAFRALLTCGLRFYPDRVEVIA